MTTKAEIGRFIAGMIKHHPRGITTGELYKLYGSAFEDIPGGIKYSNAIDLISKSMSAMVSRAEVDFQENANGHRTYFPINSDQKEVETETSPDPEPEQPIDNTNQLTDFDQSNKANGAFLRHIDETIIQSIAFDQSNKTIEPPPIEILDGINGEIVRSAMIDANNKLQRYLSWMVLDQRDQILNDLNTIKDGIARLNPEMAQSIEKAIDFIDRVSL